MARRALLRRSAADQARIGPVVREYSEHMKTFTNPGEIHPTGSVGEYVVHQQVPGQPWQLYVLRPDAAGDERYTQLSDARHNVTLAAVAGEGAVFYIAQDSDERGGLFRVPLDGSSAPEPVHDAEGRLLSGLPYGGLKAGERTAVAGFMTPGSTGDADVWFYEVAGRPGTAARLIQVSPFAGVFDVWDSGDRKLTVIGNRDAADPWRYHCQVLEYTASASQHGESAGQAPLRKVGGEVRPTRDLHPAHRTAAVSPNGEEFLYQRECGDWLRLYTRPLAGGEGELVATELNDQPGDLVGSWHPTDPNVLLVTRFHGNHAAVFRLDRRSGECTPVQLPEGYNPHKIWHGAGQYSQAHLTSDGKVTLLASSPTEGPHFVVADPDDPAALKLIDPLGGVRPPAVGRREEVFTIPWTDDEPSPEHNVGTLSLPIRYIEPTSRERPRNGWRTIFLDNRGGPHLLDLANRDLLEDALLECGYALAIPEYPGREGYGTRYREALLKDPGRVEARSFDAACRHLQDAGLIDPGRVGFRGWSWGGRIGALLAEHSHRFSAILAGTPVVDQLANHDRTTAVQRRVIEHRHGGTPAENPVAYARASAAANLPGENASAGEETRYRLRAPKSAILYLPAEQDVRCPDTTVEHCRRQRELGRDADRYQMPGGHLDSVLEQQIEVLRVTLGFFEEKLRATKDPYAGVRMVHELSRAPTRRGHQSAKPVVAGHYSARHRTGARRTP